MTDLRSFVEQIARMTLPQEEFDTLPKDADGNVLSDGLILPHLDDYLAEMSGDRLCDEYATLLDLIREARLLLRQEPTDDHDGHELHHDIQGWYIVSPDEERDEQGFGPDGVSLGFDGRDHYATEAEAWGAFEAGDAP